MFLVQPLSLPTEICKFSSSQFKASLLLSLLIGWPSQTAGGWGFCTQRQSCLTEMIMLGFSLPFLKQFGMTEKHNGFKRKAVIKRAVKRLWVLACLRWWLLISMWVFVTISWSQSDKYWSTPPHDFFRMWNELQRSLKGAVICVELSLVEPNITQWLNTHHVLFQAI